MFGETRGIAPGEAARRLGVSTRTVQRWLRQGRLEGVRVGTRLKVDPSAAMFGGRPIRPLGGPIRTLAIANRGEIVARIARTCRSLGIRSVAIVAADQAGTWWTEQTDARVPLDGDYLDVRAVIGAARAAGADALHPGYGFLSENPSLAEAVEQAGLAWLGPPAPAMRLVGDKAAARRLAGKHGIPLLPASDGRAQSDRALLAAAERIAYPVLVKPLGGGGGKGMHVARTRTELREVLEAARREADAAFGDRRLLVERYLDRPRHVEIQILFDRYGEGMQLGERECSLQRRHQKVLEESPSPRLLRRSGARLRRAMADAALRLGSAAGYVGAGTVEFLVDEGSGEFFFLEVNARLQVEHPVTELVTGRDLVADQLNVAAGSPIGELTPLQMPRGGSQPWRHAIEARLYAEDAEQGFLPASGRIVSLRWPAGEGIRVDAGVGEGDEIGTRYDPLLAKIVAGGTDRADAVRRLRAALESTVVLGPVTNLRFLRWMAGSEWFGRGGTFTDTIPTRWHPDPEGPPPDDAWAMAAHLLAGTSEIALAGWRVNTGPRLRIGSGTDERTLGAADQGSGRASTVEQTNDGPVVHIDVDGRSVPFRLAEPPSVEAAVRHAVHSGASANAVTAPMPGRVIAVPAREGAEVELHEPLVILEAMKMENAVAASTAGTVAAVLVRPGQQVQKGDLLVEIAE